MHKEARAAAVQPDHAGESQGPEHGRRQPRGHSRHLPTNVGHSRHLFRLCYTENAVSPLLELLRLRLTSGHLAVSRGVRLLSLNLLCGSCKGNRVCAFTAIVSAAIAAVAAAAALCLQLLWPSVPVAAPSLRALDAAWPRGPPHGARDRKRSREKLVGMRRVIKKASDCRRFKALISYQVRLCVRYLQ